MTRKWLCALGILFCWVGLGAQQRWLGSSERLLSTDGVVTEFALPNPVERPDDDCARARRHGLVHGERRQPHRPHESRRQRSRRVSTANPESSPRIIALGADGNMWFSEHSRNQMGRITPRGEIAEFRNPDAEQPAARDCARRRRQHLVR